MCVWIWTEIRANVSFHGCESSHYPLSRTTKDADGRLLGVCGTVELLNSRVLSTQPIVSMDWRYGKWEVGVSVVLATERNSASNGLRLHVPAAPTVKGCAS